MSHTNRDDLAGPSKTTIRGGHSVGARARGGRSSRGRSSGGRRGRGVASRARGLLRETDINVQTMVVILVMGAVASVTYP